MFLRCYSCANSGEYEFTDDNRWAVCLRCGAHIDPDEGKIMLSLDEENAQRLPALRKALRDAFDDGNYDLCERSASEILEYLPNNFLATFYRHLSRKMSGDARAYEQFMRNLPAPPSPEDAREAFERALDKLELSEYECVSGFIQTAFNQSEQRERANALNERRERMLQELGDGEDRPRGVFLCVDTRVSQIEECVTPETEVKSDIRSIIDKLRAALEEMRDAQESEKELAQKRKSEQRKAHGARTHTYNAHTVQNMRASAHSVNQTILRGQIIRRRRPARRGGS